MCVGFDLLLLLTVCHEIGNPLAGGNLVYWYNKMVEDIWDYGIECPDKINKQHPSIGSWVVMMLQYELQSLVDCIIH